MIKQKSWVNSETDDLSNLKGYNKLHNQYSQEYRDNDRIMIEDPQIVDLVWDRIKSVAPKEYTVKHANKKWAGDWKLFGINPRFRFCRYEH